MLFAWSYQENEETCLTKSIFCWHGTTWKILNKDQLYNLGSHTIYVLCVLTLYMRHRSYSLKTTSNATFLYFARDYLTRSINRIYTTYLTKADFKDLVLRSLKIQLIGLFWIWWKMNIPSEFCYVMKLLK